MAIAIVGRTHIPLGDVAAFRKAYGLPARRPEVIVNGPDPGDLGMDEDAEADLDVEWSGAAARNADIRFVVSGSTDSTDGADLSSRCIVDRNLAPIMSLSFGQCETQMGAAELAFFREPVGPGRGPGHQRPWWPRATAGRPGARAAAWTPAAARRSRAWPPPRSTRRWAAPSSTRAPATTGGPQGPGPVLRPGLHPRAGLERERQRPAAPASGPPAAAPPPLPQAPLAGGPGGAEPGYRCLPDVSLAAAGGHDGYVV